MDRPVIVGRPKTDRPRGKVPCPGPHTDRPGWRDPANVLCPRCWHALPGETQRLLRAGVPAGAAARRWTVAKERLAAGTPLGRLRVDDVPIDDLRLRPLPDLAPCDVREDFHPEGECPTPYHCPTPEEHR